MANFVGDREAPSDGPLLALDRIDANLSFAQQQHPRYACFKWRGLHEQSEVRLSNLVDRDRRIFGNGVRVCIPRE